MKIYDKIRSIILDLVIWLYLWGSVLYLASLLELDFPFWLVAILALIFTLVFRLLKDSPGIKLFNGISKKWYHSCSGWIILLLIIMTILVGWNVVQVDLVKLFTRSGNAKGIVSGLFDPNYSLLSQSLKALAETIYLALLATVLAVPLAFVLSFLAARNLMPKTWGGNFFYYLVRTIATIFRSIEALVWAIIFTVWVGIGAFAGMLALMIHSVAALTKLYSEQIENIDRGQVEAIKATGANTLQVWIFAVIPQIISPYLAFTIYRWDINVRMATIVGFVGGGGIGLLLVQHQQLLRWQNVGLIIWLIALVVWIMDMVSGKVREKLQEM